MMDAEDIRFVRNEIAKQVRIILSGSSDQNTQFAEDVVSLYPGMAKISQRPVMHPYGFASRAPSGTIQVTARQGDHPGNRVVLGHRDAARPAFKQGEVVLYNAYGQQIYLQNGKILLGSMKASHPVVLGDTLNTFLESLLTSIMSHTHASPGTPPTNLSDFATLKAQNLDNSAILSKEIFGE